MASDGTLQAIFNVFPFFWGPFFFNGGDKIILASGG